jgi:putative ABC transport system permease protein
MPLATRLHDTFDEPRFYAITLGLFAALALTTAVLGVYGILAYAVERRRVELSVRRALGANEAHVIGLVMRRSLLLGGAGIALGLAAAAVGSGLLQALLFGIGPFDPASFAGVAAGVLAVVVIASWQPVRRALRVAPADALRTE